MANVGGTVVWNLDVDSSKFNTGLRKASSDAKTFGNELDKGATTGGKSFSKIGIAALAAATAIAVATTAALKFGVSAASQFEQSRVAFETMLGSAEKARTIMTKLSKFAEKTPFDLPQVREGAQRLLAYNIEANKLLPTFKALGNIAAGVGKDKLPQLILAFGQVRAAGKLTGMELRQFTEAGVPLLDLLSKQTGKSAAEIKDAMENGAAPSFEVVEKAIFSASERGGKFFNLMDKQSKTFSGTMSNLRDVAVRVMSEIVGVSVTGEIRQGSLFDTLRIGGNRLLTFLQTNKDTIIKFFTDLNLAIRNTFGWMNQNVVPVLVNMWNAFKRVWEVGSALLLPLFAKLWEIVKLQLVPAVRELWAKHGQELKKIFTILATSVGVVLLAILVQITTALVVLSKAITVAVRFFTFMASAARNMTDTLVRAWNWVKQLAASFVNLISSIGRPIKHQLGPVISAIKTLVSWVTTAIGAMEQLLGKQAQVQKKGVAGGGGGGGGGGSFGENAKGTNNWRGGMTWVGEKGPELINLPKGTKIFSNPESERMVRSAPAVMPTSKGSTITNYIDRIIINKDADADRVLAKLTRDDEIISRGLIPITNYGAING